jgi:hypothetical protein
VPLTKLPAALQKAAMTPAAKRPGRGESLSGGLSIRPKGTEAVQQRRRCQISEYCRSRAAASNFCQFADGRMFAIFCLHGVK